MPIKQTTTDVAGELGASPQVPGPFDPVRPSPPATPPKPLGKMRQCWNCGADMGFIENRYYDRSDTCGAMECNRAAREAAQAERDEAHEQLDRDNGWDR